MKLNQEYLREANIAFGKAGVVGAIIKYLDLYESEMRPKDAAPVMPDPKDLSFSEAMQALMDGKKVRNKAWGLPNVYIVKGTGGDIYDEDGDAGDIRVCKPNIVGRWEIVTDPTPEEKAEAEFEDVWKSECLHEGETGYKTVSRRYWLMAKGLNPNGVGIKPEGMAAKFPAEGVAK